MLVESFLRNNALKHLKSFWHHQIGMVFPSHTVRVVRVNLQHVPVSALIVQALNYCHSQLLIYQRLPMNNHDMFLFAVVAVAFIAGYSIVSFIVRKLKPQERTATYSEGKADQSQQKEHEGTAGESTSSNANQGEEEAHEWWEGEQEPGQSETWKSQTEEQEYGKVLGLKGGFSVADVKRAYRKLIAKYHPDKIDHLGDEFKDIAETKTREINEAYDFFRKKYDIR